VTRRVAADAPVQRGRSRSGCGTAPVTLSIRLVVARLLLAYHPGLLGGDESVEVLLDPEVRPDSPFGRFRPQVVEQTESGAAVAEIQVVGKRQIPR
jgi:hypothetical protein